MTSSMTTPPPPPAPTPPPGAPAGRPAIRARELFSEAVSGTPGRMRVLGAVAIVACLAFGVLGFLALLGFHSDVEESRTNAEQLVRVQAIRTNLVKADASATNAFLVGGLEPPAVREAYSTGIAATARTLAEASAAQSHDSVALERVNRVLTEYTGLIEAARANNRQGFPIGAAYLRQASRVLRDDALPRLATLVRVEQQRFEDSTATAETAQDGLVILIVLALLALVVAQVYLSRKTRRTFNRPLLAATAAVFVTGLLGYAVVAWTTSQVDDARAGPYRRTVAIATARIGGFDAKSDEALTLISRGSGSAYEALFRIAARDTTEALQSETGEPLSAGETTTASAFRQYVTEHEKLRALDDGGQHDQAVAMATGEGTANAAFRAFERASAGALARDAGDLADDLSDAATALVPMAWLVLLAGIAAAVLAWRGISERLREYR